jgi:hypothetical protein
MAIDMSLQSLLESILEQFQTGRGELKVSVSSLLRLSSHHLLLTRGGDQADSKRGE